MAGDFQGFALEKAELLSSRLKEVLSSGQGFVRAQFGVDLGLEPELYPTWVILSTAAVGLLLLLGLSWAAVCGGALVGKKRGSPVIHGSCEPEKANVAKTAKPEEQKKRNKKKTLEKKNQSNGQPVAVPQEEVKVTEAVSKQAPQIKTEKVHEVQAPVQVKKNKKKTKTDVKPVPHVSTNDGKEPDDGAWETKVSNREKKQQRRKDKGSEDSGSPGGVEAPKTNVEAHVATAPTKTRKNRGNHESLHARATGKGDAASGAVSTSWKEEPSVNGGGLTDISMKIPGKMGLMEGTKWSTSTHYRAPPKRQSWAQEPQAVWGGIDGRIKTDLNPVSLSMLGRNTRDGMAAVDPSSDWNAPAEHWGNYEEPLVLVTPAPPQKAQPVPNKLSEDEKDTEDPSSGASKSKKKRKKKKKAEEETATEAQPVSSAPQELPVLASKKQNPSISSSQKKSEQIAEPPKPTQKKKLINAVVLLILLSALNDPIQYRYHLTSSELGTDIDVMDDANICIATAISLLMILICGMATYGAYKQHAAWIIPFFCYQIFDFALNTLVAISVVVYPNTVQDYLQQLPGTFPYKEDIMSTNNMCLVFAVLLFIGCILSFKAYLIGCVWNCYRYVSGRGTTEVLVYVTTNDTTVSPLIHPLHLTSRTFFFFFKVLAYKLSLRKVKIILIKAPKSCFYHCLAHELILSYTEI
uniref:Metadherin a n=1 Tax=Dicentrarchus labrax TaxID=13489 RepID=A0A8C4HRX5_DICLA